VSVFSKILAWMVVEAEYCRSEIRASPMFQQNLAGLTILA
jgi:hypothetical protein